MAANNIDKMTDYDMMNFATRFAQVVEDGVYGLPADLPEEIAQTAEQMKLEVASASAARTAYRRAVSQKQAVRTDLLRLLSAAANIIFANPEIGPNSVIATGLKPRKPQRSRIRPVPPEALLVEPLSQDRVLLKWDRADNPQGMIFLVEAQHRASDWELVTATTRCQVTLGGFPAGEYAAFRVSAQNAQGKSSPCTQNHIYPTKEALLRAA